MHLGERAQIVKLIMEKLDGLGFPLVGTVDCFYMLHILMLQTIDDGVGSLGILLIKVVGNLHQCIGGSRHSRENNDF